MHSPHTSKISSAKKLEVNKFEFLKIVQVQVHKKFGSESVKKVFKMWV